MAKKIGIIRCDIHSLTCHGVHCFSTMQKKTEAFAVHDDDLILVGYSTCGGCCGRDAMRRAKIMVDQGAEAIHLSNCLCSQRCPFTESIKSGISALKVPVIQGTHKLLEKN